MINSIIQLKVPIFWLLGCLGNVDISFPNERVRIATRMITMTTTMLVFFYDCFDGLKSPLVDTQNYVDLPPGVQDVVWGWLHLTHWYEHSPVGDLAFTCMISLQWYWRKRRLFLMSSGDPKNHTSISSFKSTKGSASAAKGLFPKDD